MDIRTMAEKKKTQLKTITANIILVLILICSVLIIMDITANITLENESYENNQGAVQPVGSSDIGLRPTFPPDYTPEPIEDA